MNARGVSPWYTSSPFLVKIIADELKLSSTSLALPLKISSRYMGKIS